MLREMSQDVVAGLKDTLRDVRHLIRTRRSDRPAAGAAGPSDRVIGRVAVIMDDALSLAETVSLSLLPVEASPRSFRLRGLPAYFAGEGPAGMAGARLFRREMYQGAKEVLRRRGIGAARIHEADFLAVHAALGRKEAALLARLGEASEPGARLDAAAALTAALLVEMAAAAPVRFEDAGTAAEAGRGDEAALRVLAPLALAHGIATLGATAAPQGQILEAAILGAEARRERIAAALRAERPGEALARIFTPMLAHLP